LRAAERKAIGTKAAKKPEAKKENKKVALRLKFTCNGWSHSIQCTVSCIEEFEGYQGVWNQTGGFFGNQWKWVQRQGYAERCKLKELLGANCVKHVKACFNAKKHICGKFSATQRLIKNNRFTAERNLFAKKSATKGAYITQQQFEDIYYNRAPKYPQKKVGGTLIDRKITPCAKKCFDQKCENTSLKASCLVKCIKKFCPGADSTPVPVNADKDQAYKQPSPRTAIARLIWWTAVYAKKAAIDQDVLAAKRIGKVFDGWMRGPWMMAKKVAKAAKAAGFCKDKLLCKFRICKDKLKGVKEWARDEGIDSRSKKLAAYAKALAGKARSEDSLRAVVAKAAGLGTEKPQKLAQDAAKKGGFCMGRKCTTDELRKWGKARMHADDLLAPLSNIATLFATVPIKADDQVLAADRIALSLDGRHGKSQMKADAKKAAKAAGICKGKVCDNKEIKAWAHKYSMALSGPLGAYAKALEGKALNLDKAADVVAAALGMGDTGGGKLQELAQNAAKKGEVCRGKKCTAKELVRWSRCAQMASDNGIRRAECMLKERCKHLKPKQRFMSCKDNSAGCQQYWRYNLCGCRKLQPSPGGKCGKKDKSARCKAVYAYDKCLGWGFFSYYNRLSVNKMNGIKDDKAFRDNNALHTCPSHSKVRAAKGELELQEPSGEGVLSQLLQDASGAKSGWDCG